MPRLLGTAPVLLIGPSVAAQMLGHDLAAEWRYPDFGSTIESHLVTVSDDLELPDSDIFNSETMSIDITDSLVRFVFSNTANWLDEEFNGWYFEDVNDTLPPISGYALESYGGDGTLLIDAGWSENAFWASFSGSALEFRDVVAMRVSFVPAPGSVLAAAIAAIAAARRRR